jgi:hypothetical protein
MADIQGSLSWIFLMKRSNFVFLLIFLTLSAEGQRRSDYGISGGVSSYIGDINSIRLLYSPEPALGFLYRYNLNPRQALKVSLLLGGLSGNDLDFANSFQQSRAASFSTYMGELAVQYEFNFFPYSTDGKLFDYSPYIGAGAGVAFIGSGSTDLLPLIPLTAGFKINILKNLGLEAEYGFRKTFYDNFDGLKDLIAPSDYDLIHNNDWYSFTGVSLTWKFMNGFVGCPAYNDADSGRKR